MDKKYFLTFYFECGDEKVYECNYIKSINFDTGKTGLIVNTNVPIKYLENGKEFNSYFAILTHRYSEQNILNFKSQDMPIIVYVCFLKEKFKYSYDKIEFLNKSMLINWMIGEVYDNYDDAISHKSNLFNGQMLY